MNRVILGFALGLLLGMVAVRAVEQQEEIVLRALNGARQT